MRNLLIVGIILCICLPAAAIDKTGLFSVGPRVDVWLPMGPINQSVLEQGSFGGLFSYGLGEAWSIVVRAALDLAGKDADYFKDAFPAGSDVDFNLFQAHLGLRWNMTPRARFDPFVQFGVGFFSWPVYKSEDPITIRGRQMYESLTTERDPTRGQVFSGYVAIGGEYFTDAALSLEFEIGYDAVFDFPRPAKEETEDLVGWNYENQLLHILTLGLGLNLYI
ncbi:MAG: hypothetical protein NTW26_00650 [bacterium]|nr:hypothetical protein [bacterium]